MSKEKKIYVVGIGPGSYEGMTGAAATALEKSDVIVGYTVYIDLVKDHFPGKSFLTTPMRKEVDRCVMAFDEAMKDQTVSMICSGDAGVYGMAGLMYEIGANYPEVELEVVAGVTAATGGAAVPVWALFSIEYTVPFTAETTGAPSTACTEIAGLSLY